MVKVVIASDRLRTFGVIAWTIALLFFLLNFRLPWFRIGATAICFVMALRAARVGLVFDGDQLTIRSWFRTQALQLDVIESASCVNYDGLLARSNIDPMMLELTIHDGAEELRLPVRAVAGGDVVAAAERFNHELRRRRSGRSPL